MPEDLQAITQQRNEKAANRHIAVRSFRAKADAKRTAAEKFADWMTNCFGSVTFLVMNALWFCLWIVVNLGVVPGIVPFDPFPFGLLTMIVSLEAIFLAIIVLISQNREARIADLREEVDLQINRIAEEEVTKMIQLQLKLLEKNGVNVADDPELLQMVKPMRSDELEDRLQRQLEK